MFGLDLLPRAGMTVECGIRDGRLFYLHNALSSLDNDYPYILIGISFFLWYITNLILKCITGMQFRLIITSFVVWLLLLSNFASAYPGQGPAEVETVTPEKKQIYNKIHSVGVVSSSLSTFLLAESSGKIRKINFASGGMVKVGDVLAQIDDHVAKANMDAAAANANLAQLKFDRAKKLFATKTISPADYDKAVADLAGVEAEKAKALDALNKTKIIAPFDGVVGFTLQQEFDNVQPGDKIFKIEQFNPLQIEFKLPQRFYGQIKKEDAVEYAMSDGLTSSGHIIAISDVLSQDESFGVKAIVANPENKITPGIFASIDVQSDPHQALLIPQQAIVLTEQGPVVYILSEKTIKIMPVVKGQNFANMVEIKSGISESDQVIISGQMKLYPGMEAHTLPPEATK